MQNFSQTAAFIWSVADLLRGDFKQSQYGRIILPFTLLRRLECVLAPDKQAVLEAVENVKAMKLPEAAAEKLVLKSTSQKFFNTSPMDLSKLGESGIQDNLNTYVQSFSRDAREIFEYFNFDEFVGQLNDANLLYKVVEKFANTDLSPQVLSNYDMGLVFEELIRRFAESSNETAGEHFTPRDIVRLTTSLVFMEDDEALTKPGIVRTIYDPTAGTGGFLSVGRDYVLNMNNDAVIRTYGQELNPESYAICKADMLIKGDEVDRIKLGNTLSNDQFYNDQFDYMLSNPPFGVDWKKVESEIKKEHDQKGFDGRFGPGLPRVSDGSLLFLMHLISKMRDSESAKANAITGGGRIGIILNGSPLFTGGAGSGESEIRRYVLEADLLEAIVALPTDMFYNTGIATYVWILSNNKSAERRGKVQLINAVNLSSKMRKSLGSKRKYLTEDDIATITRDYGKFADADALDETTGQPLTKIFNTTDFGYRRITIERPLRLSVQMDDERLNTLRFAPKPFNAPMQWIWEQFGSHWSDTAESDDYGDLAEVEKEIRIEIKASFPELKEKQVKELLGKKLWRDQHALMNAAYTLRAQLVKQMGEGAIVSTPCDDFNHFDAELKKALKAADLKLDAKQKKQLLAAISWTNPQAAPVIKKVLKEEAQPKYGAFAITLKGKPAVVEYETDSDLRDNENVPLAPSKRVEALIEEYFDREVAPHVPDAWIDANKRDDKDGEIGIVGYEIPFNRHFYVYQPPRSLEEIDKDLDKVSREIMDLLAEVHS